MFYSGLHWGSRSGQGTWTVGKIIDSGKEYVKKNTTGFNPMAVIDNDGGAHVVFLDRVSLVDDGETVYENAGNLRYGYRRGTGDWEFVTLLAQVAPKTPKESPQLAMRHPALAVSPNGGFVVAVGMIIETNLKDGPEFLRLTAVPVDNGLARKF